VGTGEIHDAGVRSKGEGARTLEPKILLQELDGKLGADGRIILEESRGVEHR
jgi:hypothetical protein